MYQLTGSAPKMCQLTGSAPKLYRRVSMLGLLAALVAMVCGSGEYEIRMASFRNHAGVDSAGGCCDNFGLFCSSACDHRFQICVDHANGNDDPNSCAYGHANIPPITNQDIIVFGDTINGLRNSFIFPFDRKPAGVKVKIDVWDHDSITGDDHVVTHVIRIPVYVSGCQNFTMGRSEMSLTFSIRASCHENYYANCSVFCHVPEVRAHREMCDPDTGEKICRPGFEGDDCINTVSPDAASDDDAIALLVSANDADACSYNPCQNGGTCMLGGEKSVCDCSSTGFTGSVCQDAE